MYNVDIKHRKIIFIVGSVTRRECVRCLRIVCGGSSDRADWRSVADSGRCSVRLVGLFQSVRSVAGAVLGNVQAERREVLDGRFDRAHAAHDLLDVHRVVAAGHFEQQVVEVGGRRRRVAHQGHDVAALRLDVHDAGDVDAEVVYEPGGLGDGQRRGRRTAVPVQVREEHPVERGEVVAGTGRGPGPQRLGQVEAAEPVVQVLHAVGSVAGVVGGRRKNGEIVGFGRVVRRGDVLDGRPFQERDAAAALVRPAQGVAREHHDREQAHHGDQAEGHAVREHSEPKPLLVAVGLRRAAGLQQLRVIRRRAREPTRVVEQRHLVRLDARQRNSQHRHRRSCSGSTVQVERYSGEFTGRRRPALTRCERSVPDEIKKTREETRNADDKCAISAALGRCDARAEAGKSGIGILVSGTMDFGATPWWVVSASQQQLWAAADAHSVQCCHRTHYLCETRTHCVATCRGGRERFAALRAAAGGRR